MCAGRIVRRSCPAPCGRARGAGSSAWCAPRRDLGIRAPTPLVSSDRTAEPRVAPGPTPPSQLDDDHRHLAGRRSRFSARDLSSHSRPRYSSQFSPVCSVMAGRLRRGARHQVPPTRSVTIDPATTCEPTTFQPSAVRCSRYTLCRDGCGVTCGTTSTEIVKRSSSIPSNDGTIAGTKTRLTTSPFAAIAVKLVVETSSARGQDCQPDRHRGAQRKTRRRRDRPWSTRSARSG